MSRSYHLKWSSHIPNMESVFTTLFESSSLADVTLYCGVGEGSLRSHRLILSTCSNYFLRVFLEVSSKRAVVLLPDISFKTMKLLLQFIYTGEVRVEDGDIKDLLEAAEVLDIKGLKTAYEEEQKKSETNRRKTRSPRQYIPQTHLEQPQEDEAEEEEEEQPKDLSNRKTQEEEEGELSREEDASKSLGMNGFNHQGEDESAPSYPKYVLLSPQPGGNNLSSNPVQPQQDWNLLGSPQPAFPQLVPPPQPEQCSTTESSGQQAPVPHQPSLSISGEEINNVLNTSTLPTCPLCGKDCYNFPNLRTHLHTHSSLKPFACDFCDAKFTRASHLSRHRRTHTGEKPFECSKCGKLFSRQDKMKTHVDRHKIREEKSPSSETYQQPQQSSQSVNQTHHWTTSSPFPSQVNPFPTYYDTIQKNQQSSIMTSFLECASQK